MKYEIAFQFEIFETLSATTSTYTALVWYETIKCILEIVHNNLNIKTFKTIVP